MRWQFVGDKIIAIHSQKRYEVAEVGVLNPNRKSTCILRAGQVGYLVCNMKNTREVRIGDTFCSAQSLVTPLPGFSAAKPTVFAGIYPADNDEYLQLEESLSKLTLNDASITVHKDFSMALGRGWRLGFLGSLHIDVFRQRLEEEYNAVALVTQPSVPYRVIYRSGESRVLQKPVDFPSGDVVAQTVAELQEPMVLATIIFPQEYTGAMLTLCESRRGEQQEYTYIDGERVLLRYRMPLVEVINDFYDRLKSQSSGYASVDYEDDGYQAADLVKMNVLLNGEPVDVLSMIVHRASAHTLARTWAKKLANVIERQQFEIAIQVTIANKVIARETIRPYRKDVTAKLYGGDVTRRMKLLEKQKAGKKRMKSFGRVNLPHDAFFALFKKQ